MLVRDRTHPEEPPGEVLDVDSDAEEVLVAWPDGEEWVPVEDLERYGEARPNPPQVIAPEVQHLEIVPLRDKATGLIKPTRDDDFTERTVGPPIRSSQDVYELFKGMGDLPTEHLVVGMMDVRGNLTGWEMVHKGHLAAVEASPRKMLTNPLLANAHSIFMLHNHPSSFASPSEADDELTDHMVKLGQMMEIPLWDHLIIGRDSDGSQQPYYSFRDDGKIPPIEDDGT